MTSPLRSAGRSLAVWAAVAPASAIAPQSSSSGQGGSGTGQATALALWVAGRQGDDELHASGDGSHATVVRRLVLRAGAAA